MSTTTIPQTHQQIMPYLVVPGAAGFSAFVQEVFGAKETYRAMRDESTVMHAEVMIGNSTIMFADSTAAYNVQTAGLFIYVEDADAAFRRALKAGATVVNEMADQSYGRSGGVKDPFGITWWITSV
ncbi:VOC family protein [Deminuibacter soli]|uniref:VOC family protein n=1 Tax=Deminuibacter soli TaxID=2291815 RepID=A0A3E1NJA1_9BACT|nr:VOC family protein [Deminuibacter soli]RFM28016.1 VOC family protein [Deminuibacter soli]